MDEEEQKRKRIAVEKGQVIDPSDESDVLIKIPNRLLVTPYHV